jgi:hypothetical protein
MSKSLMDPSETIKISTCRITTVSGLLSRCIGWGATGCNALRGFTNRSDGV